MRLVSSTLIVLAIWAAIYLPALGSLPIKGEEGRRILPGITMLETGNYLVPQVGGETYFNKPPLINWLVAGSIQLFGHRNEWTARLPSVLSVLAVAIAFVTVARSSLGARGSLVAAIVWLANAGLIEKGRLIEIEALYVSLCALAIIFWLSAWEQRRSPWVIWLPASIFLGLGLLTKGPVHLIFFYAVVLAVLWQERNWRPLFHPAHFVALLLMLGIFGAWAIPFTHATNQGIIAPKWSRQLAGRIGGSDFKFSSWSWNIPRGLFYFFPWAILLPLVRPANLSSEKDRQLGRALVWGVTVPFLVVNLLPGALPRYAMPALGPACWMMAMTLTAETAAWSRWIGGKTFSSLGRQRMISAVTIVVAAGVAFYALAIVPILQGRENIKGLAAQIDRLVSNSEPVYALDPSYQPIFFYMRSKLIYTSEIEEVPTDAHYLLVRPEREQEVLDSNRWAPRQPHQIIRSTDYRKESIILLKIE